MYQLSQMEFRASGNWVKFRVLCRAIKFSKKGWDDGIMLLFDRNALCFIGRKERFYNILKPYLIQCLKYFEIEICTSLKLLKIYSNWLFLLNVTSVL